MSRSAVIRNDKLLEVARRVFLMYGYGVPVKVIAAAAGVSEGSLFKHFKTKLDLFMGAMTWDPRMSPWEAGIIKVNAGDARKTLQLTGLELLTRLDSILPCTMMVRTRGNKCSGQCFSGGFDRLSVNTCEERLTSCFNAWIRHGTLVMADPKMKAQVFLSALIGYAFRRVLFGQNDAQPDEYVREVVEMTIGAGLTGIQQNRIVSKEGCLHSQKRKNNVPVHKVEKVAGSTKT